MSTQTEASDARGIAEEVIKELEQDQTPVEAKPEPEEKPEVKAEEPKEEPKADPEEKKPERPERQSKYVPVQKANQWRHEANEAKAKAAELERTVAELRASQEKSKADDLDSIAKEVAGEEASPEVVKRILEAAKRTAPQQDISPLLALKQELDAQKEEQGFQRELTQTLSRFPELKGHEAELREAAYAEGNEKVPMELLAYKLRDELNLSPAAPSAEGKASQARTEAEPDYENLTDKDVANMSDEEIDKFIAWQQKSLQKRTGIRL